MKPFESIKTRTKDAKKVEVLDKAQKALDKITAMDVREAIADGIETIIGMMQVEAMKQSIETYEHFDAVMDDISTEVSSLSGVDVRKEGMDKAIAKLLGSDKYGTVFDRAAQYYSAKILKDAVMERAKKYE